MQCVFCGKENDSRFKLCWNCGKPVNGDMSIIKPVASTYNPTKKRTTSVSERKKALRLTKILAIIAMATFFLPFSLVSCSETVSFSGFEIMLALSPRQEIQEEVFSSIPPNIFLILAFFFILCFFISMRSHKILAAPESSQRIYRCAMFAASAVSLILFRLTAGIYYDISEYIDEGIVTFEWGWWISLIVTITAAGSIYYPYNKSPISSQINVPHILAPSPTTELERYKALLDSGAITQDEYDIKKKQLLGL